MQKAQAIIKDYRRKRVIVCVTVALLALILTLGIRFISQRNVNQERIQNFADHTVHSLEKVLLSLENRRDVLQAQVGQPCSQAQLVLRKQAAILQTVRSIALIKDGLLEYFRFTQRACKHVPADFSRARTPAGIVDRPVVAKGQPDPHSMVSGFR